MEAKLNINRERVRTVLLWLALPLLVGVLIAAAVPRPVIGVIRLNDAIYAFSAQSMVAQIRYADEHPEVRAVVLAIDSPGGTVADTESVYLELARLRLHKPVVTSVGAMAASGAYYISAGTDYIYARPTSDVGNVGVIGYLPPAPAIIEGTISTGPYKLFGSPRDTYTRQIEMIKQGFYQAVTLGRGDKLKAPRDVILRGEIWSGSEALRLGLIDQLGSETDAIEKAAQLGHVSNYEVVDLATVAELPISSGLPLFFQSGANGTILPYPAEAGIYLLYIPPSAGK